MVQKAKNGQPAEIDPNNPAQFASLDEEYLITPRWQRGLIDLKNEADGERKAIQEELTERSVPLNTPVSNEVRPNNRYFAYQDTTRDLLKGLADEGYLLNLGDRGTAESFANDSSLRERFGIFTKGTEFPSVDELIEREREFRAIEAIAGVLRSTAGVATVNTWMVNAAGEPLVPAPEPAVKAAIEEIEWNPRGEKDLKEPVIEITDGVALPVRLVLQGSPAALLDFTARLESLDSPLFSVVGMEIGRVGKQVDSTVADAPVRAELVLCVLDFGVQK